MHLEDQENRSALKIIFARTKGARLVTGPQYQFRLRETRTRVYHKVAITSASFWGRISLPGWHASETLGAVRSRESTFRGDMLWGGSRDCLFARPCLPKGHAAGVPRTVCSCEGTVQRAMLQGGAVRRRGPEGPAAASLRTVRSREVGFRRDLRIFSF